MSQDSVLEPFVTNHVALLEPLAREANLAYWDLQTTSNPAARDRSTELATRLAKLYADPRQYALLKSLSPEDFSSPLLARQHTLLLNDFLGKQMSDAVIEEMVDLEIGIEDSFNTYRAGIRGEEVSDNAIDDILADSEDASLREEAWKASKTVGAVVVERLLHLVRLRNREAQRLGFRDYYQFALTLQEVEETRLFSLLDSLEQESASLWESYRNALDQQLAERFKISPDQVRPWHHANRFFQEPGSGEADLDRFFAEKNLEEITSCFFSAIGMPVDDLLERADLYEREGKCQHAFCMDVDRQGDVRVLCNNRPNERWMGVMLHEFGHAVYDKFCDHALPFLLRQAAHTMTTEAIALYMGRLTKDARWLRIYAGVEPEEAERIASLARKEMSDHLLVFMHWCQVMAHFERGLYADPEQDLDALWWSLVERFQRLHCPPEDRPAHAWASKIHIASAPVYYHNYLLGEMVASQLLHTLETEVLAGEGTDALMTSPEVGGWMRDVLFAPGAIRPWEGWLEHATGEPLNPVYFARNLAS